MKFSVIVPAYNEERLIGANLKRLREVSDPARMDLWVVDGASTDRTVEEAGRWADRVLQFGRASRGGQLRYAAAEAAGDLLLFLHADAQLPAQWQDVLERFWLGPAASGTAAAAFRVDYGKDWNYRIVSALQNWRASRGFPRGDQGLCVPLDVYRRSGGYADLPVMEDFEFCSRLRALGRVALLPLPIWPSSRRLWARGPLRNALRNAWYRLRFKGGVSPDWLWEKYYSPANNPERRRGLRKGVMV